jgi:hypothetical protein
MHQTRTDVDALRQRIVSAFVATPAAWLTPKQLAVSLDVDVERLTDELAEMDLEGSLATWEQPNDIAVTISAPGAARYGLELEVGPQPGAARWSRSVSSLRNATQSNQPRMNRSIVAPRNDQTTNGPVARAEFRRPPSGATSASTSVAHNSLRNRHELPKNGPIMETRQRKSG